MAPPRHTVGGLRRQDWAWFVGMFAAGGVVSTLVRREPIAAAAWAGVAAIGGVMSRRWSRLYPAPMPHAMRWILYLSHPGLSPRHLHRVLAPRAGERLLEIGPGIGHHALPTAAVLGAAGRLAAVDLQPEMLGALAKRAARRGLGNIAVASADAQRLPYPDGTFDGAYLVTVLGEVPEPARALGEMARVVRPGGRIVVGELVMDPDYVAPETLSSLAAGARLVVAERSGSRLAYFARLTVP